LNRTLLQALLFLASTAPTLHAGGYERSLDVLLPRVVKLYGLGAGAQAGYGTGVMVSPDGLVLTVFSLLIDARRIRAVASDGTLYDAEVVKRDTQRQLALLRLRPPSTGANEQGAALTSLPHFDMQCKEAAAATMKVRPGDWVVVAGNPFKVAEGAEPMSVAHGVISARTRLDARRSVKEFPYHGDVLVVDAITSNPGAPGSAVVDLDGRLVGMIGREVVSNLTHTHFNYAMPRDVLCEFLLEASGDTTKTSEAERTETAPPTFDPGIRLTRTGYRKLPPMVERVRRGSSAERAGVRPDDLILTVNGKAIGDAEEYDDRLRALTPGEPVDVVIRRGRSIVSVRIEAEKNP